jgi:putative ABC transport system substrate-binding protein
MKRRVAITLIGGAAMSALWSLRARSADKVYRVAFVVPIGQFVDAKEGDAWKGLVTAFLGGLRELGYIDGKNMKFEFYSAEGKFGQIDELAARVLHTSPDAVLAAGGGANEIAHAFQRLTRTVPIVMANSSDPAAQGLVASLAPRVATSRVFRATRDRSLKQRDCSCCERSRRAQPAWPIWD